MLFLVSRSTSSCARSQPPETLLEAERDDNRRHVDQAMSRRLCDVEQDKNHRAQQEIFAMQIMRLRSLGRRGEAMRSAGGALGTGCASWQPQPVRWVPGALGADSAQQRGSRRGP